MTWKLHMQLHLAIARLRQKMDIVRSFFAGSRFPFRHRLEMTATLTSDCLTLETILIAAADSPVPVTFGFHPYVGLPKLPRAEWRLQLPALRHFVVDQAGLPTGEAEAFGPFDARLDDRHFDEGFAVRFIERQSRETVEMSLIDAAA